MDTNFYKFCFLFTQEVAKLQPAASSRSYAAKGDAPKLRFKK